MDAGVESESFQFNGLENKGIVPLSLHLHNSNNVPIITENTSTHTHTYATDTVNGSRSSPQKQMLQYLIS